VPGAPAAQARSLAGAEQSGQQPLSLPLLQANHVHRPAVAVGALALETIAIEHLQQQLLRQLQVALPGEQHEPVDLLEPAADDLTHAPEQSLQQHRGGPADSAALFDESWTELGQHNSKPVYFHPQ